MRGTLLNAGTVAAGALVGIAAGHYVPESYKAVAMHGMGLVTLGVGTRMCLQGKNPLIPAVSIAAGGVLGLALGLHDGIAALAGMVRDQVGQSGSGSFVQAVVTTFVLFCVGPMTLLGCMEDALENKIDLLSIKSAMDGIGALFFAAAMGVGVLLTALLLLVFQGALTIGARFLRPIANDIDAMAELASTGGAILLGTGLGLLDLTDLHTANYLPAIFIAPAIAMAFGKRKR